MDLDETLTSEKLETEGQWVPFGADGEILVARMYTDKWNAVYRRVVKPVRRQIANDEKLSRRMLIDAMGECILLGWKGITIGGKEVKFSKAKAVELMNKYPALREAVVEAATEISNFQEDTEEDLGN